MKPRAGTMFEMKRRTSASLFWGSLAVLAVLGGVLFVARGWLTGRAGLSVEELARARGMHWYVIEAPDAKRLRIGYTDGSSTKAIGGRIGEKEIGRAKLVVWGWPKDKLHVSILTGKDMLFGQTRTRATAHLTVEEAIPSEMDIWSWKTNGSVIRPGEVFYAVGKNEVRSDGDGFADDQSGLVMMTGKQ